MTTTCIIDSYNYARYIEDAVESVLAQEPSFDQILLVDDGSSDDTIARVSKYCDRIAVVQKENGGQLSCFNEGVRRATGEIIFFLDSDDLYDKDYLRHALQFYDEHPDCDFLYTAYKHIGDHETLMTDGGGTRCVGFSVARTRYLRRWVGATTSSVSVRRSVLQHYFPIPHESDWKLRADDCLIWASSMAGAKKYYLDEALVSFRVHSDNQWHHPSFDNPERMYRREIAVGRLFSYLLRDHTETQFAGLLRSEFRSIESPTREDLRDYVRMTMKHERNVIRKLGVSFLHVLWYYRTRRRGLQHIDQGR